MKKHKTSFLQLGSARVSQFESSEGGSEGGIKLCEYNINIHISEIRDE